MKKSWQIELRNWTCYFKLLIKQVEELFVPILELVAKSEWEQEEHNERKAVSWRLVVVVELFAVKSRQVQLNGRCFWLVVISGCVGGALNLLNFHGVLQGLSCWIVWWFVGLEFVCYISSFWSIMNPSNDNMPLHWSRHCKHILIQRTTPFLNFVPRMFSLFNNQSLIIMNLSFDNNRTSLSVWIIILWVDGIAYNFT
jgi:hypothetical protein